MSEARPHPAVTFDTVRKRLFQVTLLLADVDGVHDEQAALTAQQHGQPAEISGPVVDSD